MTGGGEVKYLHGRLELSYGSVQTTSGKGIQTLKLAAELNMYIVTHPMSNYTRSVCSTALWEYTNRWWEWQVSTASCSCIPARTVSPLISRHWTDCSRT